MVSLTIKYKDEVVKSLFRFSKMNEQYSLELVDELRGNAETQVVFYQSLLKNIQLYEELNYFSELGTFDRDFVENELSRWLNYTTDNDTNKWIEDRLVRIPFEQAYCYKNPEFHTKSIDDILLEVFNCKSMIEWRNNPALVRNLSIQEKLRIIKQFEYMCYYVINTREEMLFDIQYNLNEFDNRANK